MIGLASDGGMPTDNAYKWGGVGYLLGCCALLSWAGSSYRTVKNKSLIIN